MGWSKEQRDILEQQELGNVRGHGQAQPFGKAASSARRVDQSNVVVVVVVGDVVVVVDNVVGNVVQRAMSCPAVIRWLSFSEVCTLTRSRP
jgi:hypothetical protein